MVSSPQEWRQSSPSSCSAWYSLCIILEHYGSRAGTGQAWAGTGGTAMSLRWLYNITIKAPARTLATLTVTQWTRRKILCSPLLRDSLSQRQRALLPPHDILLICCVSPSRPYLYSYPDQLRAFGSYWESSRLIRTLSATHAIWAINNNILWHYPIIYHFSNWHYLNLYSKDAQRKSKDTPTAFCSVPSFLFNKSGLCQS